MPIQTENRTGNKHTFDTRDASKYIYVVKDLSYNKRVTILQFTNITLATFCLFGNFDRKGGNNLDIPDIYKSLFETKHF